MSVIVVAEDNPDIRDLVSILLGLEGHEVVMTSDGQAALEACREKSPALALLDVAMPGDLDGLDVTRRLRADPGTARLPIMLLTARAMETDVAAGFAAGANDYLVKPFAAQDMLDRVRALLSVTQA